MARKRDQIDLLCEQWAKVRRELLGLRRPLSAREYIGPLRCTLGARRDLHSGARTAVLDIRWPEVYTGELLIVNRAVKAMKPDIREIVDVHWTVMTPRDKNLRADLIGLSPGQYWRRVSMAKEFIAGALAIAGGNNDGLFSSENGVRIPTLVGVTTGAARAPLPLNRAQR